MKEELNNIAIETGELKSIAIALKKSSESDVDHLKNSISCMCKLIEDIEKKIVELL